MKPHLSNYQFIFSSPVGNIGLSVGAFGVELLGYVSADVTLRSPRSGLASEVKKQLNAYFNSRLVQFDLPLELNGTTHQIAVWDELLKIPCSKTKTYGGVAKALNSGARAVGNACRNNPVSIIVPCHRVVSSSGLGGYSGSRVGELIARKKWLLQHEKMMQVSL